MIAHASLVLDGLDLTLSGHRILSSLSLQIRPGEKVALIGPSGAGKTSLLRVLSTELQTTPALNIGGIDPWALSSTQRQQLRRHIGMIWQKPPLPASQRVLTAVQAGRLGHWSLARALYALWQPQDLEQIEELFSQLGINDKLLQRCGELSGGQLQRVGIARVLYQSPRLILADEPVSALDPVFAKTIVQLLVQHAHKTNATLVTSLHAVDLALQFFPRIVGLRAGQIVFDCAAHAVSISMLENLYAGESGSVFSSDGFSVSETVLST